MYQSSELPNGLRTVTVTLPGRQSVSIGFWVKVGSRYEPARLSGMSHFIEHMLFKGTKGRSSRRIREEIEGSGGLLNAFTSEESTCYFTKIMHSQYARALDVLSDMYLNAVFDVKEFEKEREVIIEEIKMYEDVPAQYVQDVAGELLWPDHPLGRPISGSEKTLRALTRNDMEDFKNKYYHPGNLIVVVAGNVEHSKVVEEISRRFQKKAGGRPGRAARAPRTKARNRVKFISKNAEQANFVIGVHAFSRYHPDRYKLALLNLILGGNMSSRLFEALRERRGLAYDVRSSNLFLQDTGALLISAGAEPSKTHSSIKVILKEIRRLEEQPVRAAELRRAKDYFISQFLMSLEDSLDHMFWAGEALIYRFRLPSPDKIEKNIEKITADDLRQTAVKIFRNKPIYFAAIGPLGEKAERLIKREF